MARRYHIRSNNGGIFPNGFEDLYRHFETPALSGVQSYVWNFGDGTIRTDDDNTTSHTYATSGYYTVTLTQNLSDNTSIQSEVGIFVGPGTRYIQGHTIYGDETWYSGGTYVVQGGISVAQGGKLTIESGTQVELNSCVFIDVSGALIATGVKFTARDQAQQWGGICFENTASNKSRLENCVLEYAYGYFDGAIISVRGTSPTIKGCTIDNCNSNFNGITISNGSPAIQGNTINGLSYGIYVDGTSSPTVTGNTISNNQYGIWINSGGSYKGNSIKGNSVFGIYYSGTSVIDVTHCNWGDPSGPLDSSDDRSTGGLYNPNGKGDKVSDHVNYYPWGLAGDLNGDGQIELEDAIITLQILSGLQPTNVSHGADINGDGKIGMAEAIYLMQLVAGILTP